MADAVLQFSITAAAEWLAQSLHELLVVAGEVRILANELAQLIEVTQRFANYLVAADVAVTPRWSEATSGSDRSSASNLPFAVATLVFAVALAEIAALGITLTLATLPLLALLTLLPLLPLSSLLALTGLSLLALLTLLSLLALLTLLVATLIAAAPKRVRLAVRPATALLSLRQLLHLIAHGLYLGERFLDVILAAGTLAGLALLPGGRLRLLQLIAEVVQPSRDAVLAHPGRRSVALPDPLRVAAHIHLKLVLLGLCESIANFGTRRILRARHTARRIGHLLFQVFQLVGHLAFFLGQAIELLLRLPRLQAPLAERSR